MTALTGSSVTTIAALKRPARIRFFIFSPSSCYFFDLSPSRPPFSTSYNSAPNYMEKSRPMDEPDLSQAPASVNPSPSAKEDTVIFHKISRLQDVLIGKLYHLLHFSAT